VSGKQLTQREREVFLRICKGLSNKAISQDLNCALKTIECHVTSILRKAGVGSRLELAVSEHLRLRVSSDPGATDA
jgi:two-component system, NarL family, response regulator LiaR